MLGKFKTAFVLVVIGALAGFLIWGTNELTYDDIIANREIREQAYYKDIFDLEESVEITTTTVDIEDDFKEITILDKDSNILGYIYKDTDTNNFGDVTVLVGITLSGEISNVIISNSANTVTYVKGVKDDQLPLFTDQLVDDLEFDGTASATFTYGSVKKIVKASSSYYLENRGGE